MTWKRIKGYNFKWGHRVHPRSFVTRRKSTSRLLAGVSGMVRPRATPTRWKIWSLRCRAGTDGPRRCTSENEASGIQRPETRSRGTE